MMNCAVLRSWIMHRASASTVKPAARESASPMLRVNDSQMKSPGQLLLWPGLSTQRTKCGGLADLALLFNAEWQA